MINIFCYSLRYSLHFETNYFLWLARRHDGFPLHRAQRRVGFWHSHGTCDWVANTGQIALYLNVPKVMDYSVLLSWFYCKKKKKVSVKRNWTRTKMQHCIIFPLVQNKLSKNIAFCCFFLRLTEIKSKLFKNKLLRISSVKSPTIIIENMCAVRELST